MTLFPLSAQTLLCLLSPLLHFGPCGWKKFFHKLRVLVGLLLSLYNKKLPLIGRVKPGLPKLQVVDQYLLSDQWQF